MFVELIIAGISALVAFSSIVCSVITYRITVLHDRKQATLESYNRLQTEVFDFLNMYTTTEIDEICKNTKSENYKVLSGYIARIEHFCVGVNEKIYDRNVFYKLAHGYFDGPILQRRVMPILDSKKKANEYYANTYELLDWMNKKCRNDKRIY